MTTFTLTGITKRVNLIYYHVAYTFSDGRIRYTEMRNYLFGYYFTEDHKYGILNQDHFTDMLNGDMDGTNNTSETINRSLKKFSSCGAKNLNSVFRTIYNFKLDCNKRIANKLKMRKRKTATTVKYSKILENTF